MNNRIIITVGTSLLASACWAFPEVDTYDGITEEADKRMTEANNREILEKKSIDELTGAFKKHIWDKMNPLRDLPAELATFRILVEALEQDPHYTALAKGDEIILIHSDNDDGSKCAKVQEKLLKVLLPELEETISRKPIPNLDPDNKKDLGKGLEEIKRICTPLMRENGPRIFLNLTGGYKAVSMILSALAAKSTNRITITYGHESANMREEGLFTLELGGNSQDNDAESNIISRYFDNDINAFGDCIGALE